MNLEKEKYIILELIPSHSSSKCGKIVQLQALKLDGLKLIDRFDYRLKEELIENKDLQEMISYDKDMFKYIDDNIFPKFKQFIEDLPLLIIDNFYTRDYLSNLPNKMESVFNYLNLEIDDNIFNTLITKYKLQPSNHFVDLLYEAIILESNKKK